ncbi:MAG: hypothetical protein HC892_23595, partial [Saprospiraceae bacterium]|nr:hypothetical protein [Saprospiraceae bacterium]
MDSIFIKQSPVADFDISPLICEKNNTTFITTSDSVTNWEWKFGDGNIAAGNPIVNNNYANIGQFLVTLAVESANGCRDTIIQPIEIQPLPRFNTSYSMPDPCLLNVAFSNETSADAFQWRFGDGSANSTQTNPLHTYPASDTYSATLIANLDGCLDSISIEVTLPDIPSFEASFEQPNLCAPSSVDFSVFNVANVDSWKLQFGDGFNSFEPSESHTYFVPNTYFATIQAKGGDCVIDTTFEILVGDTLLAKVQRSQNIACLGAATGSIEINVNSGNSPYSFDWSNGLNVNPAVGLSVGAYQVTITDILGCQLVLEDTLQQPQEALTFTEILLQHASCYEASDGAIEIAAVGGTSPYKYLWNTRSRNRSLDNLVAGDYTVSIEDANGCILEETIVVLQPDPIQIAFEVEPVCYDSTGSFTVFVDGGTPPFLISLSQNFDNLGDFYDDLLPGRYTIYVEDSNGCQEDAVVEIEELPDWILRISPAEADILKGDSVFLTPFISLNQATFEWQPIDSVRNKDKKDTQTVPLLDTTLFQLKATDQFGCVKYATSKINVKDTFAIFIPNAFTPGSSDRGKDGINDYFTAYSKFPAVKMIKQMVIANKWGTICLKRQFPLNRLA